VHGTKNMGKLAAEERGNDGRWSSYQGVYLRERGTKFVTGPKAADSTGPLCPVFIRPREDGDKTCVSRKGKTA